ncbi:MAG: hypothetical protein R6U98_06055 [Pirellulaceae bacterium]
MVWNIGSARDPRILARERVLPLAQPVPPSEKCRSYFRAVPWLGGRQLEQTTRHDSHRFNAHMDGWCPQLRDSGEPEAKLDSDQ